MPARGPEQASYLLGLVDEFKKEFPEQLSHIQLLALIYQANPEAADFMVNWISSEEMKNKGQESLRHLELALFLEQGRSGIDTFSGIAHPSPDIHTPTQRIHLTRNRQRINITAHSPPILSRMAKIP